MKIKKNLFLLALAVIFSGCVATRENQLQGTVWRPENSPEGARLEITMDARLVGTTPDNYFFAPVKFPAAEKIAFSPVAMTRRAGPNGAFEQRFMEALNHTSGYRLDGKKLVFLDAAGRELIRFDFIGKSEPPAPATPVEDGGAAK